MATSLAAPQTNVYLLINFLEFTAAPSSALSITHDQSGTIKFVQISDTEFETFVASALDELPEKYVANLSNVAIVYADDPSDHQRQKLKLRCGESLYGLYEGVPLTARGSGYNLVLPDKITIFKNPLVQDSPDLTALKANIKHTLWHEIAHHFGLGHGRIHQLERQALKKRDSV